MRRNHLALLLCLVASCFSSKKGDPGDGTPDAGSVGGDHPDAGDNGGRGPSDGGPGCQPTNCDLEFAECGVISDNCGGTLSCGDCSPPDTCGGAGVPNRCGCTPATSCPSNRCGSMDDGCGGTIDCNLCQPGEACDGTGHCQPNVCAGHGGFCNESIIACCEPFICGNANICFDPTNPSACYQQPCGQFASCCDDARYCVDRGCGLACGAQGHTCAWDSDCCEGGCVGGICAPQTCTANGGFCIFSNDCCSNDCSPDTGQCACWSIGTPCLTGSDELCCSGSCRDGWCSCGLNHTGACQAGQDCCSGLCDFNSGTCTCIPDFEFCFGDAECCTGSCVSNYCQ